MKRYVTLMTLLTLLSLSRVAAAEVQLEIELPRLDVAEYHPPYVAVWLEDSQRQAEHIAVWYDIAMRDGEGKEWLKDMRQWWRRGGRSLDLPIDGVTGATKGPGTHTINSQLNRVLSALPAGDYVLNVEASREVGGREVLRLPLTLPLETTVLPLETKGERELARITLTAQN
ncbi:DUF2271 domain-containing protein [Pseudidiomarina sediminum]|uniref:DUF2271 domain-containing protein n=1 Tax=Pseudidiomarina sediminum TaxID=431675 RepID=A0A432Z2V2_9GAMM|nr:DUF2271 domain-containing protein [Pseudidiomarina sediminum]RUO72163.1 DUF2271 domain-containing protein [Pseudidiomarina sediminum]